MSHNLLQWLELRRKAIEHQRAKESVEQHIALNVAQQYWRLLTNEEQTLGLEKLAHG